MHFKGSAPHHGEALKRLHKVDVRFSLNLPFHSDVGMPPFFLSWVCGLYAVPHSERFMASFLCLLALRVRYLQAAGLPLAIAH